MNVKTKEIKHVVIPIELANAIEKIVSSRLGYITVSEYVREAIREKLVRDKYELEKMEREEDKRREVEEFE